MCNAYELVENNGALQVNIFFILRENESRGKELPTVTHLPIQQSYDAVTTSAMFQKTLSSILTINVPIQGKVKKLS